MPWFPCPRQAAGGVLALEALRLVRAIFRIRRSSFGRAPVDSHDALSMFEAMDVDNRAYDRGHRVGGLNLRTGALAMCVS